ncbi:hypothetical protein EJ03DRAFT_382419 [Teratosphaeria nubilosa]|uniref:Uncharacterized protein n=1 Tax=Teratosphaeria nubilosa TaxID=161662 RepID=A0A6G1LAI6_9PEZI|nr:hypothetical protein EJ03DRAFT_382419 [Teratosphaeria nubilosa]
MSAVTKTCSHRAQQHRMGVCHRCLAYTQIGTWSMLSSVQQPYHPGDQTSTQQYLMMHRSEAQADVAAFEQQSEQVNQSARYHDRLFPTTMTASATRSPYPSSISDDPAFKSPSGNAAVDGSQQMQSVSQTNTRGPDPSQEGVAQRAHLQIHTSKTKASNRSHRIHRGDDSNKKDKA